MMRTLALAAAALAFPAAAQNATLRVHHFLPAEASPHALLVAPWADRVEKESGGRLRFELFPSMQLGGTPMTLADQLRAGDIDAALLLPGAAGGRYPRTEVFEIPFLDAGAMAGTAALQDYYDKHLREEYRDFQVILLWAQEGALIHANRPIARLEDFKGLKIRAANRAAGTFLRGVGAIAVGSPLAQLPGMLARGLLDGCLMPYELAATYRVHEDLRHHVALGGGQARIGTSVLAFVMNRDAYAALAPGLRAVLDAHSGRHLAWYAGKSWDEAERAGLEAAKRQGNRFSSIDGPELERIRAAVRPEVERFLDELSRQGGFDAAALYADAKAMLDRHSRQ